MKSRSSIKSKDRVRKYGEVFTPAWLVNDMCDLIPDEIARLDSRILEPSCGEGAFLIEILARKIASAKTNLDVLVAVSNIYGVDILADNIEVCKKRLSDIALNKFPNPPSKEECDALNFLIDKNIIVENFLTMNIDSFQEWNEAEIESLINKSDRNSSWENMRT